MTPRPSRRMPTHRRIWSWWEPRIEAWMPEVNDLLREAMWVGGGMHPMSICWGCALPFDEGTPDRAHLAGRFLGDGLDTEANLILLCRRCHRKQPDSTWLQGLLWIRRRAYVWNHSGFMAGQFVDTSLSEDEAFGQWQYQLLTGASETLVKCRLAAAERSVDQQRAIFHDAYSELLKRHDEAERAWNKWHPDSAATQQLLAGQLSTA